MSRAPGWVIAATWESIILIAPLTLPLFGKHIPWREVGVAVIIFLGTLCINIQHASKLQHIFSYVVVLIPLAGAIFVAPIGDQIISEISERRWKFFPAIHEHVFRYAPVRTLMMSVGSLPLFVLLLCGSGKVHAFPSLRQVLGAVIISFCSGLVGLVLFLKIRFEARSSEEITVVEATTASEVLFSFVGEIIFLRAALPGPAGTVGILLIVLGMLLFARHDSLARQARHENS